MNPFASTSARSNSSDPCCRHEDQIGALQGKCAHHFDEAQIVANAKADLGEGQAINRQAFIAGCEDSLFAVEQMELAIMACEPVRADQQNRIVQAVALALAKAAGDEDVVALRQRAPRPQNHAVNRIRRACEPVRVETVTRCGKLGQKHDAGAVARRTFDGGRGPGKIAVQVVKRALQLNRRNPKRHQRGSASAGNAFNAFNSGTSAGAGPPTLTTVTPEFALTACFTPTGTWTTQPAWNGNWMSLV